MSLVLTFRKFNHDSLTSSRQAATIEHQTPMSIDAFYASL